MQNNLQIVTRDTSHCSSLPTEKPRRTGRCFPHFNTKPLTTPCCDRTLNPTSFFVPPPNVFRIMDLLQQINETTAICTAYISLKTALTSPSEYQVNKTYLRIYLSVVFSVQSQILHSAHAVLRQISLSVLKVSNFSKHLPSSDYKTQDPTQIPPLLSSVCYLFLPWENKNIDWWFALHLNLRKQLQLWSCKSQGARCFYWK